MVVLAHDAVETDLSIYGEAFDPACRVPQRGPVGLTCLSACRRFVQAEYDHELGISHRTKNYRTGIALEGPEALDRRCPS
ncbi:hypothetical protein [Lentzea xinjiangensis]|uniref:hypothetical protein n=1 Tax=Lentzea xinjiangensis TaxID=402600 RepID=UPI0011603120